MWRGVHEKTILRAQASFMLAVYFAAPQGTELIDWWSGQAAVFKLAALGLKMAPPFAKARIQ